MKKIVCLLFCIMFFTGCTVKYNLTISVLYPILVSNFLHCSSENSNLKIIINHANNNTNTYSHICEVSPSIAQIY